MEIPYTLLILICFILCAMLFHYLGRRKERKKASSLIDRMSCTMRELRRSIMYRTLDDKIKSELSAETMEILEEATKYRANYQQ
jgi:hypothetical protein